MAELRTEEEQIEAIKRWWKKNGSSLLLGIALALAIVFGWQAWQNHQANQKARSAADFGQLIQQATTASTDEDRESVMFLANRVRENYSGTAYAVYAALIQANQQMMASNDPAAAAETLQWALAQAESGSALSLIVRSRLARTQYGAGNYDAALQTIRSAGDAGEFAGLLAELEGDILVATGDKTGAEKAYRRASETGGDTIGVIRQKLASLGVGGDS